MTLQLGRWQIDVLEAGRFRLDGGVMYGVVPRQVWEKFTPPDEQNMLPYAIRCILARRDGLTVLVDTGQGEKLSPLDRKSHALEPGDPLIERLAACGVEPEQVDIVLFSHLHWDHVGGASSWAAPRQPQLAFPRARYLVNRWDWEDAISRAPEFAGTYLPQDFTAMEQSGRLELLHGDQEIALGLTTRVTGGHTRGHQAVLFESDGEAALFPGDLVPAASHLRRMWCTAYDLFPLMTRRKKPQLLGEAADKGWWILWEHDPQIAVSRLRRHPRKEFEVFDERASS
ncbi:MBL fold metallo-hydrolase [Lignipirellula cremea]|uniref:Putative quorum-quenching lactonase YtnP n=1 Tax=Lignipirellula cremea TaxID=2528010 RepID=A0A518DL45_9BACT|nr:MBL fold metallo-hydrolase [Lignipirellula cremea]QDU92556.1 putative quorum-quenching lactonase YtnP [Lignipirellula cremea]